MDSKEQKALEIVSNVCKQFKGTYDEHVAITAALQVLIDAVTPEEEPVE